MAEHTLPIDTQNRVDIRIIAVADARVLRGMVLRPDQPPETTMFAGDDAPDTLHFGAFDQGQLVGIVTIMHQAPKEFTGDHPDQLWLLRGMATIVQVRGRGYGAALVRAGCAYAAREHGIYLWCEARVSALGFYQKLGFVIRGNEFEVPFSGSHYRMWRDITPADAENSAFGRMNA